MQRPFGFGTLVAPILLRACSSSSSSSNDVNVACSSTSGTPSSPAACPTAADVAYAQDFCVNTAHGTWSTTF